MVKRQVLIGLVVLMVTAAAAAVMIKDEGKKRSRKPPTPPAIPVAIQLIEQRPYTVTLTSYGRIQPKTQSSLKAQVAGKVLNVTDAFRSGSAFTAGDLLLEIEQVDYQIAVAKAEASLLEAKYKFEEEQARVAEAKRSSKYLKSGKASPLTLRAPQLAFAEAAYNHAQAELDGALQDLSRTRITAPYTGRTVKLSTNVGEVVSVGTELGSIFATDEYELRLAVRRAELPYLNVAAIRDAGKNSEQTVKVFLNQHDTSAVVEGKVTRFDGMVESQNNLMHVIATIRSADIGGELDLVNVYVKAHIEGINKSNAIVIPSDSLYNNEYVYVHVEGTLKRRPVEVAWQDSQETLIASGLEEGEELITTPIGKVTSGTRVEIIGSEPKVGQL